MGRWSAWLVLLLGAGGLLVHCSGGSTCDPESYADLDGAASCEAMCEHIVPCGYVYESVSECVADLCDCGPSLYDPHLWDAYTSCVTALECSELTFENDGACQSKAFFESTACGDRADCLDACRRTCPAGKDLRETICQFCSIVHPEALEALTECFAASGDPCDRDNLCPEEAAAARCSQ